MDRTPVHPQPFPWAAEASALGREGALVPPASSSPPKLLLRGLPAFRAPPLGLELGRALNRGRSSSASLWAWQSVLEGAGPPALSTSGGT